MKLIVKYFLASALLIFIGTNIQAQEKNKKKKQDSTYIENKRKSDESRRQEEELRRKNDSLKMANHRDSLAQIHRNDSIKYDRTRRDSIHNVEMQRRQDSIDKSQPPKKGSGKKSPPKMEGNKEE